LAQRREIEEGKGYRVRKTFYTAAATRRSRHVERIALARHLPLATRKEDTRMLYYAGIRVP